MPPPQIRVHLSPQRAPSPLGAQIRGPSPPRVGNGPPPVPAHIVRNNLSPSSPRAPSPNGSMAKAPQQLAFSTPNPPQISPRRVASSPLGPPPQNASFSQRASSPNVRASSPLRPSLPPPTTVPPPRAGSPTFMRSASPPKVALPPTTRITSPTRAPPTLPRHASPVRASSPLASQQQSFPVPRASPPHSPTIRQANLPATSSSPRGSVAFPVPSNTVLYGTPKLPMPSRSALGSASMIIAEREQYAAASSYRDPVIQQVSSVTNRNSPSRLPLRAQNAANQRLTLDHQIAPAAPTKRAEYSLPAHVAIDKAVVASPLAPGSASSQTFVTVASESFHTPATPANTPVSYMASPPVPPTPANTPVVGLLMSTNSSIVTPGRGGVPPTPANTPIGHYATRVPPTPSNTPVGGHRNSVSFNSPPTPANTPVNYSNSYVASPAGGVPLTPATTPINLTLQRPSQYSYTNGWQGEQPMHPGRPGIISSPNPQNTTAAFRYPPNADDRTRQMADALDQSVLPPEPRPTPATGSVSASFIGQEYGYLPSSPLPPAAYYKQSPTTPANTPSNLMLERPEYHLQAIANYLRRQSSSEETIDFSKPPTPTTGYNQPRGTHAENITSPNASALARGRHVVNEPTRDTPPPQPRYPYDSQGSSTSAMLKEPASFDAPVTSVSSEEGYLRRMDTTSTQPPRSGSELPSAARRVQALNRDSISKATLVATRILSDASGKTTIGRYFGKWWRFTITEAAKQRGTIRRTTSVTASAVSSPPQGGYTRSSKELELEEQLRVQSYIEYLQAAKDAERLQNQDHESNSVASFPLPKYRTVASSQRGGTSPIRSYNRPTEPAPLGSLSGYLATQPASSAPQSVQLMPATTTVGIRGSSNSSASPNNNVDMKPSSIFNGSKLTPQEIADAMRFRARTSANMQISLGTATSSSPSQIQLKRAAE